ncbi:MAG: hypothetical protein IJR58_06420, partial [Lachnospiraceae bacterium]|nr:hypothetical protein [Lachnospiraceae bacterium]
RRRESEGTGTVTHLLIVLYAQFLFWFLSAPLVRYGKMILWLPAILTTVVTIRSLYRWDVGHRTKHIFAVAVFLLFFLYKSAMLIRDDIPRASVRWLTEQQPYTVFETEPYFYAEHDGGGETLYAPVEGDRGGYMLLVSPNRVKVTLIGNKRDRFENWLHPGNGFKAVEE